MAITWAQVSPDTTLGLERSVVRSLNPELLQIEQGAQRGNNLFHSFQSFNIDEGQTVQFSPSGDVNHIFSRVTGNDASDILGTLSVLGNADLFFLNPNGIIFGPNAQLNINGSFIASTADSLSFGDNGLFSASNPNDSVLLSVNPNAFLFNSREDGGFARGPIINRAVQNPETASIQERLGLKIPIGETLGFLGGDINMDRGGLNAPDGRIDLGSVADGSRVGLRRVDNRYRFHYNDTDITRFGDITFENQAFTSVGAADGIGGEGGGSIQIRGHSIRIMDASRIGADTNGVSRSNVGSINIQAQDILQFRQGGTIFADTFESGYGTNIIVRAEQLQVLSGGQIGTGASGGTANGGNVSIFAPQITVEGSYFSSIMNDLDRSTIDAITAGDGTGIGGSLTIYTDNLLVRNGGRIANTVGSNNAQGGTLSIDANYIEVEGFGESNQSSLIAADVAKKVRNGQGGNLSIETNQLLVANRGRISTSLSGSGNAGQMTIRAEQIHLTSGRSGVTGILSQNKEDTQGNAGGIDIHTSTLLIEDGAQISARSFGEGAAGNILINAIEKVDIIGEGSTIASEIASNTRIVPSSQLVVNTERLTIANGGQINSSLVDPTDGSSFSSRRQAGNILIVTEFLDIFNNDGDVLTQTGIETNVRGLASGRAGKIEINTDTLQIQNGGFILAAVGGRATQPGRIQITARSIDISGAITSFEDFEAKRLASRISTEIGVSGIATRAGEIRIITEQLRLQDGGQIESDSEGIGAAGNIIVDADRIFLDGTDSNPISPSQAGETTERLASSVTTTTRSSEPGGDITLNVDSLLLLQDGAQISTSAEISGNSNDMNRSAKDSTRVNGASSSAIGGNILLNIPGGALVGMPQNSDITANALEGRGGTVEINAAGIFGFIPRTREDLQELLETDVPSELNPINLPTNDITAISLTSADLSGDIIINTNSDSSRTEELPSGLADASNQIEQTACRATQGSEFLMTGQGGLLPSPREQFRSEDLWEDWRLMDIAESSSTVPSSLLSLGSTEGQAEDGREEAIAPPSTPRPHSSASPLLEAQGWQTTATGDIMLIADAGSTTAPANLPEALPPSATCQPHLSAIGGDAS